MLRVDAGPVGLGFQLQSRESAERAAVNSISVDVVPAEGDSLHRRLQGIASQLRWAERVDLDRVGAVTGLRPQGEAAGSIRFREGGGDVTADAEKVVWIVIVESANAEAHLVLRFEVLAEEFDSLEPLLSEIVYRVRWDGQTTVTQPSAAQPSPRAAVVARTTGVRSGPGEEFPVIGWVTGGLQIELVRPDLSGDWWLAAYMPAATTESTDSAAESAGQLGWVSAQAVTVVSGQGATVGEDSTTSQSAHSVPVARLTNPFAPPWDGSPEEGRRLIRRGRSLKREAGGCRFSTHRAGSSLKPTSPRQLTWLRCQPRWVNGSRRQISANWFLCRSIRVGQGQRRFPRC